MPVLTEQEKALCRRAFMFGTAALREEGYDKKDSAEWLLRPEIREEMKHLAYEFKHQDVLFALTKFGAKRSLTRLAPGAVAILGQALAGPQYVTSPDGSVVVGADGKPVLMNPGPTPVQLKAASEVLDRVDVVPAGNNPVTIRVDDTALLKTGAVTVEIGLGDDPELSSEQKALSRERVRNAVELLALDFDNMVDEHRRKNAKPVRRRRRKLKKPENGRLILDGHGEVLEESNTDASES